MSGPNIHRINEINASNDNAGNYAQQPRPQQDRIPLLNAMQSRQTVEPRKEHFCHMMKFTCCPTFKFNSFIFIVSAIDIILYIITLCFGLSKDYFLAPTFNTMDTFGCANKLKLKNVDQIYRFIMPIFLHWNIIHISLNMLSQFIIGCIIESMFGWWRTLLAYFVSGIAGVLFSVLVQGDSIYSAGASTAIFGLIGALIGYLILNWKALDYPGTPRGYIMCIAVFVLVINIFFGLGSIVYNETDKGVNEGTVDIVGHIGGAIMGIFAGMCFGRAIQNVTLFLGGSVNSEAIKKHVFIMKIVSICVICAYFIIGFSCFYTVA